MLVQPGGYHASAEHARVATELILKAVLWLHQGKGTRGHNIAELLQLVEQQAGKAPQNIEHAIDVLSSVTAEIQYPDSAKPIPLHRIQEVDAAVCIEAASEVLTWADAALKSKGEEAH